MSNKTELLKTIEHQKDQLTRYEKRLRDVVHAYKGLQTEKTALEQSVKALSVPTHHPPATQPPTHPPDKQDAPAKNAEDGKDEKDRDQSMSEDDSADTSDLQQQITTVTTTLTTVLQEKSKMEANYQAEKKKLRAEHEDAVEQLREANKLQEQRLVKLEADISDWRSRVRTAQFDREREQSDHALMLRELQKMLADERIAKEQLEQKLDEVDQLRESRQYGREVSEQYEKRIHQMSNEFQVLQNRLKLSEEKANEPSPMLLELQKQLREVKTHHHLAVQDEQVRANEAEQELSLTAAQSELRVSSLEANLSELSEVVGRYERLRQQDQNAIQKLRDRVTQLDMENTALTKAAHHSNDSMRLYSNLDMDNVQAIVGQIKQLKSQLKTANEQSLRPAENIEDLLHSGDHLTPEDSTEYKLLKAENNALKEEFERYKLRAQSVLKCKKDNLGNKEDEILKAKISDLQDRLRQVHNENDERERAANERMQQLHNSISKMEQNNEQKLKLQKQQHNNKISELENEIKRHRERTVSLLSEKDHEIQSMRSTMPDRYDSHYSSSKQRYMSESSEEAQSPAAKATVTSPFGGSIQGTPQTKDTEAVTQLLAKTSLSSGLSGETSLLHFAEEQARKDIEISTLKKQKYNVESALRDLQHSVALKEMKSQNEIERLEEQFHRMERNQSRESANLEYLKNVVYKYMVCADIQGKKRMLNAISTILEFSPREKKEISHMLKSGWWK